MTDLHAVPHNLDSEQSLLGALLQDNDALERIGELNQTAFYSEAHRLIYRAITKQASSGKQWDVITVAEQLEIDNKLNQVGGLKFIGDIAYNSVSSANIGRHAEIIREHAMRREIMAAASELSELVQHKGDIHTAMDKVQSRLLSITETTKIDEPRSLADIIGEHFNTLERRVEGGKKAIGSGLADLDAILNGGWHSGQVIVLAARPSMGKTALSLHHAIHAAQSGYGVLYLSMEMVATELADRAIACIGKVSLGSLLSAKMTEGEWDGVTHTTSKAAKMSLHVLDRSGLTFYQVATYARRHKRKHGLDLLVVDYLQLMAGDDGEKRHSQIEEITRNMKTLAKELGIAILLLSQLSRKTEDVRRPKLSHLRDSGAIEQDADVVLFIHREEMDFPDKVDAKNYADIYIAKNRQGALGRIGATYIGNQVRFENYGGVPKNFDAQPTTERKGYK